MNAETLLKKWKEQQKTRSFQPSDLPQLAQEYHDAIIGEARLRKTTPYTMLSNMAQTIGPFTHGLNIESTTIQPNIPFDPSLPSIDGLSGRKYRRPRHVIRASNEMASLMLLMTTQWCVQEEQTTAMVSLLDVWMQGPECPGGWIHVIGDFPIENTTIKSILLARKPTRDPSPIPGMPLLYWPTSIDEYLLVSPRIHAEVFGRLQNILYRKEEYKILKEKELEIFHQPLNFGGKRWSNVDKGFPGQPNSDGGRALNGSPWKMQHHTPLARVFLCSPKNKKLQEIATQMIDKMQTNIQNQTMRERALYAAMCIVEEIVRPIEDATPDPNALGTWIVRFVNQCPDSKDRIQAKKDITQVFNGLIQGIIPNSIVHWRDEAIEHWLEKAWPVLS